MNYIFLLYIGDVIGNITATTATMAILWGTGNVAWYAFQADTIRKDDWQKDKIPAQKRAFKAVVVSIIILSVATILPSKGFIYTAVALTAGVEISQNIKDNSLVAKGFKVLDQYLDEQLMDNNK